MNVLVTGASGFIGSEVIRILGARSGIQPRAAVRAGLAVPGAAKTFGTGDIADADWTAALEGCSHVIHSAGRAHVTRETAGDPTAEFRRTNVDATLRLARAAAAAGVRRFIFISSAKVNGERTLPGRPFRPEDPPAPEDQYGISKAQAEEGLRALAVESGLEIVIIRPALVYGPGVRANFQTMLDWVYRRVPLPLGGIRNARSFIARENLVDLIVRCLDAPAAAGRVLLASDGEDVSTPELLRRAGEALGRPARLIPVPPSIVRVVARAAGRQAVAARLCDSLQLDISMTRSLLSWDPPATMTDALGRTAEHYLATRG